MKKKYLNIPLFIFVIVIYGAIFLKLFGKKQAEENSSINDMSYLKTISSYDVKRDSFDISTLEKDPFKINRKIKRNPSAKTQATKPKTSSKTETIKAVWPKVAYYGFVKNNSKSTKLTLLKVGTRLYRKRKGESIEDINHN